MSALSEVTALRTSLAGSFATLSQRERRMVLAAGLAVTCFVIFMVLFSLSSKAETIRRRTQEKLVKLDEVQVLAAGYREQKAAREALERQLQASSIRLTSYLDDKAAKAGLTLSTFTPKADVQLENSRIVESGEELTLTDVKLNRLVDFLNTVESGPGLVKVKYLRLEPRPATETLTAWVIVSTYHLK